MTREGLCFIGVWIPASPIRYLNRLITFFCEGTKELGC